MNVHPLFKGITTPAMVFGAPLLPLIYTLTPIWALGFILAIFSVLAAFVFIVTLTFAIFLWMKESAKKDHDHLNMLIKEFLLKLNLSGNRKAKSKVAVIPPRNLRIKRESI